MPQQGAMYCIRCQYPLVHLRSRACPECGAAFDPEDPRTVLAVPVRVWPLLGAAMTLALTGWFRSHRAAGWVVLVAVHGPVRAWGAGLFAMLGLIPLLEGRAGWARTNWDAAILAAVLLLPLFYASHVVTGVLRCAGIRDPVGAVSSRRSGRGDRDRVLAVAPVRGAHRDAGCNLLGSHAAAALRLLPPPAAQALAAIGYKQATKP